MLLFYSLDSRGYEGFMNGSESIAEGIVNSGKVKDFQEFLKENNIDYELYGCEVDGRKAIYCHFDNKDADFFKIASTGTRSLALFYYWYIRMEKASLFSLMSLMHFTIMNYQSQFRRDLEELVMCRYLQLHTTQTL